MPEENPYRLPRTVVPNRYELTLEPDLAAATFDGHARIDVDVREPVTEIVLNAAELAIPRAHLERDGTRVVLTVALDADTQRAVLQAGEPIAAGPAVLDLDFTGVLNDKLAGFYRSVYTDADGREQVIATTQMEATDARQAFPCWDEPDFKATFAVTLVVPAGMLALSNGGEVGSEALPDGRTRITYAETMRMSTYLVAFVVGPLTITPATDVDGIPLRVAHVPGREHLTAFALEAGAHALRYFADWFGIGYPGGKLDLVALPDFAFGAMENLGCVTFRETALLVDLDASSRIEQERVADVVAHEIAHMWFGDLVTMKWWNGIWLNEAFATFMELKAVDAFRPEWQRWVSFSTSRAVAMQTDSLAATRPIEFTVTRPDEAEAMFDVLTYQKGGAVLRMLEQFLGEDRFRDGIRRYIAAHAYANAETTDLWDAIEQATGDPVRSTMDSWIFQGGYPLVSVEADADGTALHLSQQRFRYRPDAGDGGVRWAVPLSLRIETDGGRVERRKLLLTDAATTVDLPGKLTRVVANDGGWGFFRVRYTSDLLRLLTGRLDDLDGIERYNLVSDTWATVLAGLSPVADFVELARLFGDETDPDVWTAVLGPFELMERVLLGTGQDPEPLRAFVARLVRPAFDRVGWEPAAGEGDRTGTLRATLLGALGGLAADPAVRAEAARLHERYLADRASVPADLVAPVVGILSRSGGEADYGAFLERYRHPATPQEEVRYLLALAAFRHEALHRRTMDLLLTPEVRSQNGAFLVTALLGNAVAGTRAWEWLREHWDDVLAKLPNNSHSRMLEGIVTLLAPGVAEDVHRFLDTHPVRGGGQRVPQLLEQLDVNRAFAGREAADLLALFS